MSERTGCIHANVCMYNPSWGSVEATCSNQECKYYAPESQLSTNDNLKELTAEPCEVFKFEKGTKLNVVSSQLPDGWAIGDSVRLYPRSGVTIIENDGDPSPVLIVIPGCAIANEWRLFNKKEKKERVSVMQALPSKHHPLQ